MVDTDDRQWRQRFRRAVADQLALQAAPTNAEVIKAIGIAKRHVVVGIGTPSID